MNYARTSPSRGRLIVYVPATTLILTLAIAFALGVACTAWGIVFLLS